MSPITGEDTVASLRARLEQTERQANARQRQLERYAADLREVFKQERARAQELRRSYMATVRALSNAVEARDAYTGKHAERVAAYGMELAGESIPLAARVFAVADALDALTTDRPYRPASSFASAREEVYKESGKQFDPAVVAAYRQIPDSTFEALRDAL